MVTRDLRGSIRDFRTGGEYAEELANLASKIQLQDFLDPREAKETSLVAWERYNNVSAAGGHAFSRKSKRRADLLAICRGCANAGSIPIWASDVLGIIASFEVPALGQNKHEK
jgi:hypothetical protein